MVIILLVFVSAYVAAELCKCYTAYLSASSVRSLLVTEAFASLSKAEALFEDAHHTREALSAPGPVLSNEEVRSISAGFIASPGFIASAPAIKPVDFKLAGPDVVCLLVRFCDAWERFGAYINRLEEVHKRLVNELGTEFPSRFVLEEYSEQACGMLAKIEYAAAEVMIRSINIIKYAELSDKQCKKLSGGCYTVAELQVMYDHYIGYVSDGYTTKSKDC